MNKVQLIGNVGQRPNVRYLLKTDASNNAKVASFSIATNEKWKDKDGRVQERTEWHTITVFRQLADICDKYLQKGDKVYVEGKLRTREYEKNNVKCYATEIVADEIEFLSRASGNNASPDNATNVASAPAVPTAKAEENDDLPF